MKRFITIMLAILMVMAICAGTALAKSGNGNEDKKPKKQQETEDPGNPDKPENPGNTENPGKGQEQKELREAFKAAVLPYLAKVKANRRAWGQAGGLHDLEGLHADADGLIKRILDGSFVVPPELLDAIRAEIQNIKAYKASLKTDLRALNAQWLLYIRAKKNYDINAGIAALQNVIDLQLKRIEARKGIFSSMRRIIELLKEIIETPQPGPSPSPVL